MNLAAIQRQLSNSAILAILRRGELVRSQEIAAETGLSCRTVYRTVKRLRDEGFPVRGEAGVGYLMRVDRHV